MSPSISELLGAFDPGLPLERAETIPSSWYTDPRILAAERAAVFGRTWQMVGRVEQVRGAGAFVTANVAGEPVLIVRGDDDRVRGFFNVCRHRAAPLRSEPCGSAAKLRCRYHGWTYDLSGRLRGTPEFEDVADFRKDDNGLVPLGGVAEWGPIVWAHLDPPREPVNEFLAPLPVWTTDRGAFDGLRWTARTSYDLACNWKVYVDNYLDGGYHVATVHPGLAAVLDAREYRTTVYDRTSLQSSPLKPTEGSVGQTRTGHEAAYWWVFPNFMLNVYSGVMDTNLVLPIGPDRCRVVFDFYFAEGTSDEFIRESIAVAEHVQTEDVMVCEEVQRGLGSRSYTTGRFSVKREAAGYRFHQLLAEHLRQWATGGSGELDVP